MIDDMFKIILILLPLVILGMTFIVALGKKPGYRRRHQDCDYPGPERRCDKRETCQLSKTCTKKEHECKILNRTDLNNTK